MTAHGGRVRAASPERQHKDYWQRGLGQGQKTVRCVAGQLSALAGAASTKKRGTFFYPENPVFLKDAEALCGQAEALEGVGEGAEQSRDLPGRARLATVGPVCCRCWLPFLRCLAVTGSPPCGKCSLGRHLSRGWEQGSLLCSPWNGRGPKFSFLMMSPLLGLSHLPPGSDPDAGSDQQRHFRRQPGLPSPDSAVPAAGGSR